MDNRVAQAASNEAHFRAGFLAGCSYGMDQTKEYQRTVPDAPDVDEAWEIHQGREFTAPRGPANMWMADSRPLLAEIASLAKQLEAAKGVAVHG